MAKLILSMDGLVLKEITLTKERTTIGRKPHNDIQIDNLAVSGEHAVIVTILNDSFLEDLGSTNGTLVNGKPVKKHFLQNNDVVELGKYKLKYISEAPAGQAKAADFEKTMVLRPGAMKAISEGDGRRRCRAGRRAGRRRARPRARKASARSPRQGPQDLPRRVRRPDGRGGAGGARSERGRLQMLSRAEMPARNSSSPSRSPRSASPACRLR